ncbi:MAG: helix-turn-helix domain-containing protein [Muribaculaceae bacterium]|nr:helix-turn-helix domain-containing protein [Muribaculaceae bacterium]
MRITEVTLTKKQRVELEYMEHFDPRPFMQKRSRIVLDKADGLPSKEIADRLSCSEHKVNRWVKWYLEQGIDGLRNKPGQGAKPIMDPSDEAAVREAIEKDRLSVMKSKERWHKATGKEACRDTYRAFLSALAQDLDV